MKVKNAATTIAFAALVAGLSAIAPIRNAAAGTKPTIFVASPNNVTAYSIASRGDVAPIALTTDMAAPSGIARDASGRIYVTNRATNTVTIYAANANGNVPPLVVIGGDKTRLSNPAGIALDASGKIYVLNSMERSIRVYPPLGMSTGILNEAPVATIAGSKTLLNEATGIAIDAQNKIYVANELGGPAVHGESLDKGRITVYEAGGNGNIAPVATISGAGTGLSFPFGIALDSSGNIYVANLQTANNKTASGGSITVYPAGSKGNASPSTTIAGDNTGLQNFEAFGIDSNGNLYATVLICASLCSGTDFRVNVFASGSNGDVFPSTVIAGADTGLSEPNSLALDPGGNLYVLNSNGGPGVSGSVTVYETGSSGDATPTMTITSNFTGLPFATDVAADSMGNLYVSNPLASAGGEGRIDIYPAGSYATGAPQATIEGADTGLDIPMKIATDSSGNIYVLNIESVVTAYAAGSVGDATPMSTLNVGLGQSGFATGMSVGPSGKLYIAGQCTLKPCPHGGSGDVAVYPSGSAGDVNPSAIIGGPETRIANPSAVAVDRSGSIYVTNEGLTKCTRGCCFPSGHGSVTVFAPGSNGDATPIATITGSNTGLQFPFGISLDSNGNIYVLNGSRSPFVCVGQSIGAADGASSGGFFEVGTFVTTGPILIFAAGSNGDAAPLGKIGGPFTGLDTAEGIAIGPASP